MILFPSHDPYANDAPAYKATIKINLEIFFEEHLKANNIIEYNQELADQKIQEFFSFPGDAFVKLLEGVPDPNSIVIFYY